MKIGIFKYSLSRNLGDEVQALAVAQHVEESQIQHIDRDHMNSYDGEKCVVVMNGWFSARPENFPPSEKITPVFFGFHMIDHAVKHYRQHVEYFKKHEPIGCRDEGTAAILKSWGVNSYFSGCATMTFPKRKANENANQVFAMDVSKKLFAKSLRRSLQIGTQDAPTALIKTETKFDLTRELLALYRERAALVVTSRIHCAMPCAAFGIPVLYVGPKERRTAVIEFLGIPTFKPNWFRKIGAKNFPSISVDMEQKKSNISADLRSRLREKGIALKETAF